MGEYYGGWASRTWRADAYAPSLHVELGTLKFQLTLPAAKVGNLLVGRRILRPPVKDLLKSNALTLFCGVAGLSISWVFRGVLFLRGRGVFRVPAMESHGCLSHLF